MLVEAGQDVNMSVFESSHVFHSEEKTGVKLVAFRNSTPPKNLVGREALKHEVHSTSDVEKCAR